MTSRRYAEGTTVAPERSRMEIETFVRRRGADAFAVAGDADRHMVQFRIRGRVVRFVVAIPPTTKAQPKTRRRESFADARARLRADEERRLWRALVLVLKAKFEAVDSGITTFDHEFLAHLVTAAGPTVGDIVASTLDQALSSDAPTNLLALPSGAKP